MSFIFISDVIFSVIAVYILTFVLKSIIALLDRTSIVKLMTCPEERLLPSSLIPLKWFASGRPRSSLARYYWGLWWYFSPNHKSLKLKDQGWKVNWNGRLLVWISFVKLLKYSIGSNTLCQYECGAETLNKFIVIFSLGKLRCKKYEDKKKTKFLKLDLNLL